MQQSIILVPVLSADPVIGVWREKYDEVSHHGMPAHVTLLFPFKAPDFITEKVINKIGEIFSNVKQFPFVLNKIGTFPHVIFLEPNPRESFIELTEAIARQFPENPPWEGKYSSINPHITIGSKIDEQKMNDIKEKITQDIKNKLPIKTNATEAWLMVKNSDAWKIKRKFRFKG